MGLSLASEQKMFYDYLHLSPIKVSGSFCQVMTLSIQVLSVFSGGFVRRGRARSPAEPNQFIKGVKYQSGILIFWFCLLWSHTKFLVQLPAMLKILGATGTSVFLQCNFNISVDSEVHGFEN